jgi:hypothetical protein
VTVLYVPYHPTAVDPPPRREAVDHPPRKLLHIWITLVIVKQRLAQIGRKDGPTGYLSELDSDLARSDIQPAFQVLQGYLAPTKQRPPRTLQLGYA